MRVYSVSESIVTGLGTSAAATFNAVLAGQTAVRPYPAGTFSPTPAMVALLPKVAPVNGLTRFEQWCITAIEQALAGCSVTLSDPNTLFILSTTKGNIELLEQGEPASSARLTLFSSAQTIANHFKAARPPQVISNACISGVMAVLQAQRLIASGACKHAVVCGADVLSSFVISGFQALNAMSDAECRPFDAARKGINLGEGVAAVVLTADETLAKTAPVAILGGAISNDANHISGPSRTGEELAHAVGHTLQRAQLRPAQLSFISAHGTATVYNDEMESKAFHLAGLDEVPLHSVKACLGHTLGAAGVIELALAMAALRAGVAPGSRNYGSCGTPFAMNIAPETRASTQKFALKTASGFGGCNAALALGID